MQTIKYTFADGTESKVEVSDEFYIFHLQLLQQEKRNHWKETRRHISLNYLTDNGIDFADNAADTLSTLIQTEDERRIKKAVALLLPEQQELIRKVFYEGKRITDIAKAEQVGKSAIANRLTRIYIKLQKFLE